MTTTFGCTPTFTNSNCFGFGGWAPNCFGGWTNPCMPNTPANFCPPNFGASGWGSPWQGFNGGCTPTPTGGWNNCWNGGGNGGWNNWSNQFSGACFTPNQFFPGNGPWNGQWNGQWNSPWNTQCGTPWMNQWQGQWPTNQTSTWCPPTGATPNGVPFGCLGNACPDFTGNGCCMTASNGTFAWTPMGCVPVSFNCGPNSFTNGCNTTACNTPFGGTWNSWSNCPPSNMWSNGPWNMCPPNAFGCFNGFSNCGPSFCPPFSQPCNTTPWGCFTPSFNNTWCSPFASYAPSFAPSMGGFCPTPWNMGWSTPWSNNGTWMPTANNCVSPFGGFGPVCGPVCGPTFNPACGPFGGMPCPMPTNVPGMNTPTTNTTTSCPPTQNQYCGPTGSQFNTPNAGCYSNGTSSYGDCCNQLSRNAA